MNFKQVKNDPKTYALIFATGDELASGLKQFATENKLSGSSFKAIGALSSVKLGWFNPVTKKYDISVDLEEQVELLSLMGDIATYEAAPAVHAHMVIGLRDGTTRGGHLIRAVIHPTCEVFLEETPEHLQKRVDPESCVPLITL